AKGRGGGRSGRAASRATAPGTAARAVAIEALVRIEAGGYSNLVLPGLLRSSGLDGRDRALVTDLVYGTLRRQGHTDHLLSGVSHRALPELDPPVRAALRLGAYQLLSGVAPHAAVAALASATAAPGVTLRPNPLRTTPEALAAELTGDRDAGPAGVQVEPGRLVPSALLVRGVGDLARLPAVAEGRATPQDQASQ